MVATYVEIIVGIRLTDEEACLLLLGMDHREYEDIKKRENINSVFVDCTLTTKNYQIDLAKLWQYNIRVFNCICCSDTTDVVVGISLRTIYRLKINHGSCADCAADYPLCDKCFSTTEQGIIDYDKTYSFAECPNTNVCAFCHSYNNPIGENCTTCKRKLIPYDTIETGRIINKALSIKREQKIAKLYFHWDDCCSCT